MEVLRSRSTGCRPERGVLFVEPPPPVSGKESVPTPMIPVPVAPVAPGGPDDDEAAEEEDVAPDEESPGCADEGW